MPFQEFDNGSQLISPDRDGPGRQFFRATNFVVEWMGSSSGQRSITSASEFLIVLHEAQARISGPYGERMLPPGSVAIAPAGTHLVQAGGAGSVVVLASDRPDMSRNEAINPGSKANPLVAPIARPFRRKGPLSEPQVIRLKDIPFPLGNPRMKFVQSETMSLNLVDYAGPRDRSALSPHEHADIEQGTLALEGAFVHHLRKAWGRDADEWVADAHVQAGPPSVLLIPPRVIHTTEGVGEGRHVLLDIFAPPRNDFREKGWVWNAAEYVSSPAKDGLEC